MTFGEQNSETDAHAQLDYAIANGALTPYRRRRDVSGTARPETQG